MTEPRITEAFTADEVAEVFWDFLKRDPETPERRQTAWGTKTKLGLALTIRRLGAGLRVPLAALAHDTDLAGDNPKAPK